MTAFMVLFVGAAVGVAGQALSWLKIRASDARAIPTTVRMPAKIFLFLVTSVLPLFGVMPRKSTMRVRRKDQPRMRRATIRTCWDAPDHDERQYSARQHP